MFKQIFKFRGVMGIFLVLVLLFSSDTFAFSRGYGGHYYNSGRWYKQRWFWFDAVVPILIIGAIVKSLPYGYTTVTISGHPYYYHDNVYFQSYNGGYVVVQAPVLVTTAAPKPVETVVPAPKPTQKDVYTVNIPNTKGGYTPVVIKKVKEGFIGPQGELYIEFPSVEQLKVIYGGKK